MKYFLRLTLLLFIFSISTANATDYYYCNCLPGASNQCAEGNKSNNGTSKSKPKKTFAEANAKFNSLDAGDTIQFCRGGFFSTNVKNTWVNNACTATNTCTITAYDIPGQENLQLARPIIIQTSNNNLFSLEDSGAPDHEEGYTFSNLNLKCTGCTTAGNAFFLYNDIDNVIIDNVSITDFRIGVYLASANTSPTGNDEKLDNITLNNLNIVNSKSQGILGGANNLVISNSFFENNGGGTNKDHNIYISRGNGILIKNNDVYRSSLSNGSCNGVPIVVHGVINNLLIEGNTVREDIGKANPGCWGIAVDTGYASSFKPEAFTNITIRGNKVINVGNIAIGIASCDTCLIENNVILQQQTFNFTAIKAPDRTHTDSGDPNQDKITIRNNSIITSSSGTGIVLGTEGTNHIVVSNAIHYTGTGRYTCFNLGLLTSAYTAVDNNICYFPNASAQSEWEAGSQTLPTPLVAWLGISGFGVNSKNVDPGFKDPTLPLINLSASNASSAIVNSGHKTLSSAKDYRGKARSSTPDSGAFEFGTFNPPAKTVIFFN